MGCGQVAPLRGHGLTRLRRWGGLERPARTGFMGPYSEDQSDAVGGGFGVVVKLLSDHLRW